MIGHQDQREPKTHHSDIFLVTRKLVQKL